MKAYHSASVSVPCGCPCVSWGPWAALAPIFKGLSLFQVAILACIGFSINLGNFVWELGTDYFVEHAGQITVQAPAQNVTHYAAITNGALESLTLQYYLNERRGMNISPGGEWNYKSNWFRSGGEYQFLFNGNAGSIQVSCVDESDALCRGKVNAVYCGWLIKTKINEAINYFRDEASGYL